jgi:hypothetical protein
MDTSYVPKTLPAEIMAMIWSFVVDEAVKELRQYLSDRTFCIGSPVCAVHADATSPYGLRNPLLNFILVSRDVQRQVKRVAFRLYSEQRPVPLTHCRAALYRCVDLALFRFFKVLEWANPPQTV